MVSFSWMLGREGFMAGFIHTESIASIFLCEHHRMVRSIYYTGIGAKKSGKHSVKEFLDIMNKTFKIQCSEFMAESEYKPCSESKRFGKTYKKLLKKCNRYKKTSKRKCDVEEYISFSGAE